MINDETCVCLCTIILHLPQAFFSRCTTVILQWILEEQKYRHRCVGCGWTSNTSLGCQCVQQCYWEPHCRNVCVCAYVYVWYIFWRMPEARQTIGIVCLSKVFISSLNWDRQRRWWRVVDEEKINSPCATSVGRLDVVLTSWNDSRKSISISPLHVIKKPSKMRRSARGRERKRERKLLFSPLGSGSTAKRYSCTSPTGLI